MLELQPGQTVRFTRWRALGWDTEPEPFTIVDVDLDRDHPLVFDGVKWRSARYLEPVFEAIPGKMSGALCFAGTRITVSAVRALMDERGLSDEAIAALYPGLRVADVAAARYLEVIEP